MKLLISQLITLAAYTTAENTLGSLELKDDADVEYQTLLNGKINDLDGEEYDMGELVPHTEMYSPEYFDIGKDTVVEKSTGEVIPVSVFKGTFDDTTILATVDENREITEAEIVGPKHVTSLVKAGDLYMTFSSTEVDVDALGANFQYGHATVPDDEDEGDRARNLRGSAQDLFSTEERELNQCTHQENASTCSCLKTLKIAIIFDGKFCAPYGSSSAAKRKISAIVSQASAFYERSMCVKLQVTRIYSPDSCSSNSRAFRNLNTDNACSGDSSFLRKFTEFMNSNNRRRSYGIDGNTAVHAFTGEQPRGGTIGCAWTGTICNPSYSYGVNYPNYSSSSLLQAVLFAHEFGHNLEAQHYREANYVMSSVVSAATKGFSSSSKRVIMDRLDSVSCDYNIRQNNGGGLTLGLTLGGRGP